MTRLKHLKKSTKEKESDMKTNDTLCVGGSIEYVVPSHACFFEYSWNWKSKLSLLFYAINSWIHATKYCRKSSTDQLLLISLRASTYLSIRYV